MTAVRDCMVEDPTSLGGLLRSLAHAAVDGLRRNKLAALLAAVTLIVSTALTLTSQFDERARYHEIILPEIERAEIQFLSTIKYAEQAPDEDWRLYYFLSAHGKAKEVVRVAKLHWPSTSAARKAHRDLIRYYELVDEEFATIRTEMSVNENLDYWAEWKKREGELREIRDRWARWAKAVS